uniref:Fucosyltransferase n=1 Tax=Parastrongyloides trichosuri TaxID=131310 RepID=A0A0N5A6C1_PARTI
MRYIKLIYLTLVIILFVIWYLIPRGDYKEPPEVNDSTIVLLSWNAKSFENFGYCPSSDCLYTDNRKLFKRANAILFNDNFYNPLTDGLNVFDRPSTSTIYINVLSESYVNRNSKIFSFLLKYPKNYFNLTYTYLKGGDIYWSYGADRWVFNNLVLWKDINKEILDSIEKKKKKVLWIVSNCEAKTGRAEFVKELSKYIEIDQFGECNDKPLKLDTYKERKEFFEQYYFYIASENSDCKYYITEKFFDRILFNSVPLVNARRIYNENIPPNSFIPFDDFSSPDEMAEYLNYLINNTDEYIKYFRYRKHGWQQKEGNDYRCYTCQNIRNFLDSGKKRIIYDIDVWMENNNECLVDNYISKLWNI